MSYRENKEDEDSPDRLGHKHDAFFKEIFSEPPHAVAFFKVHLPSSICKKVDWTSLTVRQGSFVKADLQQLHSDLLFSVKIEGRESLLYLLFEHQSSVDRDMPLRMLGYITEILTRHKTQPLPLVFPFVLHQGPDPWNVPTKLEDMFKLPADMAEDLLPFLPKFEHGLLDLSRFDPASEEYGIQLCNVFHLMKLVRKRNLLAFLEWFVEQSSYELLDRSLVRNLLNYALGAQTNLDLEKIYHTVSGNPELRTDMQTIAERLIAEGLEKGLEKGRLEGLEKGDWMGMIRTLEEFLELPISTRNELSELSVAELESLHQKLHRDYEIRFKRG